MLKGLWLIIFTSVEFLNFICAYKIIFNAKFKNKKCIMGLSFVLICLIQLWILHHIDNTWIDIINISAGVLIPLFWFEKVEVKLILNYPIIALGTSIINSCTSYLIAILLNISLKEVIKSQILSIICMSSAIILMCIYFTWIKLKKMDLLYLKFTKKQYIAVITGLVCSGITIACIQWIIQDGSIPDRVKTIGGFAISFVSVIFLFVSIWLSLSHEREHLYKLQNIEYEHYLNLQEEHIKMLIQNDEHLRRFRHDLHAHMIILKSYAAKSNNYELIKYIDDMEGNSAIYSLKKYSNHSAIDAVINELFSKAKSQGILFEWNGKIIFNKSVTVYDMCTIISNLTRNAIEACERLDLNESKKIIVNSLNYDNKLFISIKNTCPKNQEFIEYNKLLTNKKDKINHGLGTKNINDTIEKYKGSIVNRCEDGWFEVKIII